MLVPWFLFGGALVGALLAIGCRAGTAPSCKELTAVCGPKGSDDCCKSFPVPGGTFSRGYDGVLYNDASHPATVSDFKLDKYEVTVGRFRAFLNAGLGTQKTPPAEGSGDMKRSRAPDGAHDGTRTLPQTPPR
jgi:hypothetical protein